MDLDKYTPEYFSSLVEAHQKEKNKMYHETIKKIKVHLFSQLEVYCKRGTPKFSTSCNEMRKRLTAGCDEKEFMEIIQKEVVPYFASKGFVAAIKKLHAGDCECGPRHAEGCVNFIEISLELTPK